MIIYKAANKINGKSYIGQTIRTLHDRKLEHIRDSRHESSFVFHKAIRKYGKENFEWEVLCKCDDLDELNKMEKYYIKECVTFIDDGYGYNMTNGGDSYKMSTETKNKIGRANTGKNVQ